MKEISMFTDNSNAKFVVIFSKSNITVEVFSNFRDAQKKAAWMSSYHSMQFEVAKVHACSHTEHA